MVIFHSYVSLPEGSNLAKNMLGLALICFRAPKWIQVGGASSNYRLVGNWK